jgi:hypothetical protein
MLIINNINISVNQGNAKLNTYARVTEAWLTALNALENICVGIAQNVSKGSVLLGLASWHLYPNMLVLGERAAPVKFDDPVMRASGLLTMGLRNSDPDHDEGVYWSLALAHLEFYGDPVKVTSITTQDVSRLSIEEFHWLVLGSMIGNWSSLCPQDFSAAAEFFIALNECI